MAKGKFNNNQAAAGFAAVDTKKILSDLSKMADTDKITVVSEKRTGKTIIGVENTPIVFDSDGKAEVTVKEAKYLLTIPGFELDGDGAAESTSDAEKGDGNGNSENGSDKKSEPADDTENTESGDVDSANSDGNKENSENAETASDAEKAKATKKNVKGNK